MKRIILKSSLAVLGKLIKMSMNLFLPNNIENNNNSNLRVFLINFVIRLQNLILNKINYPFDIYRKSNQELYVDVGGVLLDTSYTFRYFKLTKKTKYFNQGAGYDFFFKKTDKLFFVDIGSHVGEIAIFIAKKYPKSKVLSVEGSPTCYDIQKRNILINNIKNVDIKNYILSDEDGEEYISDNFGTENFSLKHKRQGFVKNKSITLDSLLKIEDKKIDFLKIDIEGSIPKLQKDLIDLWKKNRIKYCSLSIEKDSYKNYSKIIEELSINSNLYEINPNEDSCVNISSNFLINKLKKELGDTYQSNRFAGMEVVFEKIDK